MPRKQNLREKLDIKVNRISKILVRKKSDHVAQNETQATCHKLI